MSCFSEATYSVYVDGALDPEQLHALEAHLVSCLECRSLVVALRDEGSLLSDVLHERERERERERPEAAAAATPVRHVALGFLPSLLLAAGFLTGLGWLLEARLPAGIDWLNPFRLRGAVEMAFDVVFMIRDQVPGLLELALAVAATVSVSAILTFTFTALARHWSGPGAALLAGLALIASGTPAEAHFGWHSHEDYTLAENEVHDGTLIVSGGAVNIDGVVDGDLVALAERLVVRGRVEGNVYAFAQTLELPGSVVGSVHLASERAHIAGKVGGNVYAAAEQFALGREGDVERDLLIWTEDGVVEGRVGRDLLAAGRLLELRGSVARDVRVHLARVVLTNDAEVGGDLGIRYLPGRDPDIAPRAAIAGETRAEFHEDRMQPRFAQYLEPGYYLWTAIHVAGGFAAGILLHWLLPALFGAEFGSASAFFRSLGLGLLVLIVAPFALLLTAATIAGIPLALIGLGLYLSGIFIAVVVSAELIGSALVSRREGRSSFGLALLVGMVIVVVATHAPFLAWPARIVVLLCGIGLTAERLASAWRRQRAVA